MNEIIKLKGVTKAYQGQEVVRNVTMSVEKGKIYGFLGPNGAGKTTIMKMILNLVKSNEGIIQVMGETLDENSYQYLKNIGSIIEYPVFYEHLSAYENLKLHCAYSGYYDYNKIPEVIDLVELNGAEDKRVGQFSLGMKQRLGIARAMITNPELLILDEPINGLDPVGIRQIRELLIKLKQDYNITILISSHIIAEIEQIADKIGVIKKGVLVKEVDMETIRNDTLQYIEIQVDDLQKAMAVLDTEFSGSNIKVVGDDRFRIYDDRISQKDLNKALILADVNVFGIQAKSDSLEEYFMEIINEGVK